MQLLSIIIPVYNEGNTIHLILDKIKNVTLPQNIEKEIIIINDCSTDNTSDSIQKYISNNTTLNITYFEHEINKGKGAALHTGIKKAKGDYTIIQDADLEYDPKEYIFLLQPVLGGFADVVYGTRFMGGNPH
ncbi:glycosyltransferase family 2 protein, partial [uncultured Flavobacterium sp.]|uniref:glycosyltransferase family 2 protein n=1 Tax=uncultured Flavobacterium sp. TaxID=165435 RepID=UPI0030EF48EA